MWIVNGLMNKTVVKIVFFFFNFFEKIVNKIFQSKIIVELNE